MSTVKSEMINGVLWVAIQKYSGIFIQLGVTVVLARLLPPEDFGTMAIATVLIAFFTLFTDMGIGPAIIQKKNLTVTDLNSIFSFTIWGGIILTMLFFFLSYPISLFYKDESLISICQILSVNLLFATWNIVPNALINKSKQFKFIALRTLILQVLTGGGSIIMAFRGVGIYALLVTPVLTAIGVFILNYRKYPLRFIWHVETEAVQKIFSYSSFQFLFNFMNYFSRNLDKLIIGKYFSMTDLGYYEKSYRLMMLPMQNVTNVITPVMHPVLSSLQNDYDELSNKYGKIVRFLSIISFPLGVFLFFTARDLIFIIYGERWEEAIPVFRILSLSVPFQMILSTTGAIYQAAGETKWLFLGGVSNTCVTVLGFIIAAFYYKNIEAMAWAWNITLFINIFISMHILYKIVLKHPLRLLVKNLKYPILLAIILSLVLFVLSKYIVLDCSCYASFTLLSLSTLVIVFSFIQITHQYDFITYVKSKMSK